MGRPKKPTVKAVINVSIDAELKEKAREMANSQNRSLSNWLEMIIAEIWRSYSKKMLER